MCTYLHQRIFDIDVKKAYVNIHVTTKKEMMKFYVFFFSNEQI